MCVIGILYVGGIAIQGLFGCTSWLSVVCCAIYVVSLSLSSFNHRLQKSVRVFYAGIGKKHFTSAGIVV